MRICILTQTFPRFEGDATAPFMLGLCEGLHKAGNEITVFAPYSTAYKKKYLPPYINLITYKYIWPDFLHTLGYSKTLVNDKYLKFSALFLGPLLCLFGILKLLQAVKNEKIDVISAHWILPNGFIAYVVSKILHIPYTVTLPGSDVFIAKKNILYKKLAILAANAADGITSNSPHLKDDLIKLGANIRKFQPIIYSVNTEVFKPIKNTNSIREKLGCAKNDVLVLGVGRLVEKKGFLYLVEAAKKALKENKNLFFVLVGDGDQRIVLEKRIMKYSLSKRFLLVGKIPYNQLVMYYNSADIFILPSVRDGEGNLDDQSVSVIEAMSCAKPVISSDFLGYRLIIQNGVDGILIHERDVKGIKESLLKLANSKTLRNEMGKRARNKILKNFTWGRIGRQYTHFFKSL